MMFQDLVDPQHSVKLDLLVRIPNSNRFIVTISTCNESICVWDIIEYVTNNGTGITN